MDSPFGTNCDKTNASYFTRVSRMIAQNAIYCAQILELWNLPQVLTNLLIVKPN
jgi:hypothetical protein